MNRFCHRPDKHSIPAKRAPSRGVLARSSRHVLYRGEPGLVPVPATPEQGAEAALLPRRNDGQRTNDVACHQDCAPDSDADGSGNAVP